MDYAYCWRTGQIGFGRKLPEGALTLATGEEATLREAIAPIARLAYDNKTMLVPGVPEAENSYAALEAVIAFKREVEKTLGEGL